jgi:hypothetical protein
VRRIVLGIIIGLYLLGVGGLLGVLVERVRFDYRRDVVTMLAVGTGLAFVALGVLGGVAVERTWYAAAREARLGDLEAGIRTYEASLKPSPPGVAAGTPDLIRGLRSRQ